ncbi:hypothetical protein [Aureibacter tunicatorum]|uniref:Tetratricopeptide repeat-containing protein n=1 Tax=Aureibacter tunicatorum TaxID=866807 RepID=A0AAE3XT25_9BACT|nr:hypothetical protein [Aureibacter tunicatorum]MDR6242077.1 hypothetical protein [Aureibacter tunicatorum]BDD07553.1 hypothetical protein AUTU_50360 [Aureibacter tunicatorum]
MHKNTDLIINYLDDNLDDDEHQEFNRLISEDPDFQHELELQKGLKRGIKRAARREAIKNVHESFVHQKKGGGKLWTISISIAASIAFLSIISYNASRTLATYSFMNDGYETYQFRNVRESDLSGNVYMQAYQQESWNDVISIYESNRYENEESLLMAGNAYMKIADFKNAEALLSIGRQLNNDLFNHHFEWHLMICYFEMGEYGKAYEIHEKIQSDKTHVYHGNMSFKNSFILIMKYLI